METQRDKVEQYEAPAVKVVGSVATLTGMPIDKKFNASDGLTFMGNSIGNNTSP